MTTPYRFTIDNYNECRVKCHRSLKKIHPDKRARSFSDITPGKSAVIDEIVWVMIQALELFELRVNDGKRGYVRAPRTVDGWMYFEMPEDGQIGILQFATTTLQEKSNTADEEVFYLHS